MLCWHESLGEFYKLGAIFYFISGATFCQLTSASVAMEDLLVTQKGIIYIDLPNLRDIVPTHTPHSQTTNTHTHTHTRPVPPF